MKIRSVKQNNQKKGFEIRTYSGREWWFPYAKADPAPSADDQIHDVFVDKELAREGITYVLESGEEGSVLMDWVLDYNSDPNYLAKLLMYRLTAEARARVDASPLSKREIMRRLGTSAAQFYRLVDTTNYRKSMDQLIALLFVLDCEVDFVVSDRQPPE